MTYVLTYATSRMINSVCPRALDGHFRHTLPVLVAPRHARLGGHDVLLAKVPLQQIVRRTVGEKKLPGLWAPALSRSGEGRGVRPVLKAQRIGIGGLGGVSVTV